MGRLGDDARVQRIVVLAVGQRDDLRLAGHRIRVRIERVVTALILPGEFVALRQIREHDLVLGTDGQAIEAIVAVGIGGGLVGGVVGSPDDAIGATANQCHGHALDARLAGLEHTVTVVVPDRVAQRRVLRRRSDRDGRGRLGDIAVDVGDLVGEAVGAGEAGIRRVGEGAVRIDHHRAVGRVGELHPDVAAVRAGRVVARQVAVDRRVFGRGVAVVDRHRDVVARLDRDRRGRFGDVAVDVGDLVGEAVGAAEVGVRRIGEGAVRIDHHRAVGRVGQLHPDVAAVGTRRVVAGQTRADRSVFGGRVGVVDRQRNVIDGFDDDRRARFRDVAVDVGDLVREAVGAGVTGIRRVGEGAVRIDHHRAVGRVGELHPDVAAVGTRRVVAGQARRDRRAFAGAVGVVDRDRHVIDVEYGHRERVRDEVGIDATAIGIDATVVAHAEVERRITAESRICLEYEGAGIDRRYRHFVTRRNRDPIEQQLAARRQAVDDQADEVVPFDRIGKAEVRRGEDVGSALVDGRTAVTALRRIIDRLDIDVDAQRDDVSVRIQRDDAPTQQAVEIGKHRQIDQYAT